MTEDPGPINNTAVVKMVRLQSEIAELRSILETVRLSLRAKVGHEIILRLVDDLARSLLTYTEKP